MRLSRHNSLFGFHFVALFITGFLSISSSRATTVAAETDSGAAPSYAKDVLPILRANCFGCHQDNKKQGGYLMTDFAAMLAGGESSEAAIVAGKSTESHLISEIVPVDGKAEMPKNGKPLKDFEIDIIRRWIDAGAINDQPVRGPRYTMQNPPAYVRPPNVSSIDFSPDGAQVAVAGFNETLIFETQNWQLQHRLVGLSPRIEAVRYSPDGKWLAVAAGEPGITGELQVWNNENKQLERSVQLGGDTLFGVNWSPDSQLISFGMTDNTVRAVDLSGQQKLYQRAHEDWPRATTFTADGKHVISVSRDMTVKLTEVETERFIDNITSITPGALRGGMQALTRHPTRNEIVVGGADGTPKIYRVFRQTARVIGDDANLIRQLEPMAGRIFSVAVSGDAKFLAAASVLDNQSIVKVWSYDVDGQVPEDIRAIQAKVPATRTADELKKLDTYVTPQPVLVATWPIPTTAIYAVAFDAKNRLAASGADGRLRVWELPSGNAVTEIDCTPNSSAAPESTNDIANLRLKRLEQIANAHRAERATAATANANATGSQTAADKVPLEQVTAIDVQPASIELNAWNDSAQIIVSALLHDGQIVDVTRQVAFTSASPSIWMSDRGWVQPLVNGAGEIQISLGGHQKNIPVTVAMSDAKTVDFVRDVNPVLSRLGCNAGTCHGAQAGKGGFKLSLRGYDPIFDVRSLGDDLAGRRINPASPRDSLIMSKPLGLVPHVGGKLIEEGDTQALVIRQWIAQGGNINMATPRVARIEIAPTNPIVQFPGSIQQVRVIATYVDGAKRDVTREAFLETGNAEVASVIEGARVQAIRRGEAPILARFEGAYSATTLTVMGDRTEYKWVAPKLENPIDRLVAAKWERMKIEPSETCNDAEFLRRITLDLTGLPPTADKVKSFLADATPTQEKRNKLIDELLASEAFIDHWTNKWSDLLQVNSKFLGKEGATKFRDWIRNSIASNKPYDQFVNEIVTASGSNRENPAASYYKILRTPEDTIENTTHLFLGVRFNCNKCHDHPFERWTQDQYYQSAAFFAQVGLKKDEASGNQTIGGTAVEGAKPLYEEVFDKGDGEVKHQKTSQAVAPKFPFECETKPVEVNTRRAQFSAWLTSRKNPYFARSYVNRMWGYMLGKGLIEPIDDIRAGNPASIPELLEFLERDFVDSNFDVRHLMRTICQSSTYQLSIETNRWNSDDDRNYSHALPRRLPAEVLYDSIHQVTGSSTKIPGLNPGARAASLADADAGLPDGFLNNLGRPPRESACECERSSELRLGSIMALVSGPTLGSAISDQANSIHDLINKISDDKVMINELFLRVLNRPATDKEIEAATTVMSRIQADHVSLVQALAEREEWWKQEKPKRQMQLDAEKLAAQTALTEHEAAIRPEREAAEKARLERVAATQNAIQAFETNVEAKLDEFIAQRRSSTVWQTLQSTSREASNSAVLVAQSDRSIRASGSAEKGIYTITTPVAASKVNSLRLEALTASDLPGNGPGLPGNGNFVITEVEVFVGLPDKPDQWRKLKIAKAQTDFDQSGFSAAGMIDDKLNDQGGWAVFGATGAEHWAVFSLASPVEFQPGEVLQWKIHQFHEAKDHRLGRFRLSASWHDGELPLGLPESLASIATLAGPAKNPASLADGIGYLKITSGEIRGLRDQLNRENQPLPEDPQVTVLKKRIERLSVALPDDARLIRMRADVAESEQQLKLSRLTAAEDITWALINSPAFLFNH